MHIKAMTLHILHAKKLKIVQNQEKSLWCILNMNTIMYINAKNLMGILGDCTVRKDLI